MFENFAARPGSTLGRNPSGRAATFLATLARETGIAFEALARRRYDAPWQRVAQPALRRPH